MVKLRQEMADRVAELEQQRDTDIEQLESQYKHQIGSAAAENTSLREQITSSVLPQLTELREKYRCVTLLAIVLYNSNFPNGQDKFLGFCQELHVRFLLALDDNF